MGASAVGPVVAVAVSVAAGAERTRRVYRLIIHYPETPDLTHWTWDDSMFHWPKNRCYLTLSGAQHRASLFETYGASVEIMESQPVQWKAEPIAFKGQCWLWE